MSGPVPDRLKVSKSPKLPKPVTLLLSKATGKLVFSANLLNLAKLPISPNQSGVPLFYMIFGVSVHVKKKVIKPP
ncbi:MAG: hypothetical protein ACOY4I_17795 [Bacillota bacterium]